MKYSIIVDTSFNLSVDEIKKYDINVINLRTFIDNKEFGVEIDEYDFYELLKTSTTLNVKTSAPTPAAIEFAIDEAKKVSDNVIYLCMSSKLSSTYQTSTIISRNYENVTIFDSKGVFAKNKILFDYLTKNLYSNLSFEEMLINLEKLRDSIHTYFMVKDLDYLQKNGRIGKASSLVGQMLSIKPILSLDINGSVISYSKSRSNKKAVEKIISTIKSCQEHSKVYVSQINIDDDLIYFKKKYEHEYDTTQKVPVVISVHSGPDTFAVSYVDKTKIEFEV